MKLILALLALIPALLFGAVLFLLDNPDLYRQQLNDAVKRETGFELNINGDISWRYWPPIAIKVSDIEIQPAGSDQPFLLLETAAVDLKLIPLLLGGELAIDGLTIDGLTLNAEVAADGKGNWQVADTATAAAEADSSDSSANLNLDIAHMNISNAIIRYHAPAADYVINLKSLATGAVRADETTFIEFDVSAEDTLAGLSSSFQGDGNITFSRQLDQYQFNQLAIKSLTRLPDLSDIQASMTLNGDADLSQGTANLQAGQIQLAGLQATIDLQITQMQTTPILKGTVNIQPFDIQSLLAKLQLPTIETRNPDALNQFEMTANIKGTPAAIHLTNIMAKLDAMSIKGSASAELGDVSGARFDLSLDTLTLSDYLPPDAENNTGGNNALSLPVDSEVLPVDSLKQYSLDGRIHMAQLNYDTYQLNDLEFTVLNGREQLEVTTTASGYSGQIKHHFVARMPADATPTSTSRLTVSGVDITALTDLEWLTGNMELASDLRFRGHMLSEVLDSMNGSNQFLIKQGSLDVSPVKKIAGVIDSLRGQSSGIGEWPDNMPFESLVGTLTLTGGIEANQQLNVQLETMKIVGTGGIDYWQNQLDYDLGITLQESATSQFSVKPPLAGLRWPLHCVGAMDISPAKLCLPNSKDTQALVTDIIKQELKRQGQEKLKARLPELQDKAKELLKGLFGT